MKNLNDKINRILMRLHLDLKKEWITLNEIYEELHIDNLDIEISDIKEILDRNSSISKKGLDEKPYISKGRFSRNYKSINYPQLYFINNINIGDVFNRDQLITIFKISGQSGMMKTNTLNCLVLITSEYNGVYNDSNVVNGTITYTGEGLVGNQTITKNNKTLYESRQTKVPIYLFSKDKQRRYTFEGRVELYGVPYQAPENDINGDERRVWKFPLKVIYQENNERDSEVEEISYEIAEIENKYYYADESKDYSKLEYIEGPLNIRKYRKTGKHIQRTTKPDYIAQEIVKNKQGIINEKCIFENEIQRLYEEEAHEQIKLMEDFFNNKKENEGFDILSFEKNENGQYIKKYIEVKSTKGNEGTPIDITVDEIEFAKNHLDNYYLYRIVNSDSKNRYLKVVKGKDLINNYNFVPVSFKIYSK